MYFISTFYKLYTKKQLAKKLSFFNIISSRLQSEFFYSVNFILKNYLNKIEKNKK